ncbi:hypothetical protein AB0G04_04565 [Actinoplanes sp. NPDC023801]|uniref:hypothetical protein n=1 Tax=Actinoplanes sp. NPDC023801 TaxID=3154595 RepID=UPI0033DCF6C9
MTNEHGASENDKRPDSRSGNRPEDLPRHPAARPRAEADRELVPPDADLDMAAADDGANPK